MEDIYISPIGPLLIQASDNAIVGIRFLLPEEVKNITCQSSLVLVQCMQELTEYFEGKRQYFDVAMHQEATAFRQQVYTQLMKIPYGSTASYADLAVAVGNPKAVRAIGNANHNNNIPILVPCHRVIGKNGDLVGYAGGLWRKEWLLKLEAQWKSVK